MSDKHEKKTPKEYFLTKVYAAMQEFEDTTGVEVTRITLHRVPLVSMGASPKSALDHWELELS